MTRGRKRKANPSIPSHIDQSKIPRGIYWDATGNGRWFTLDSIDGRPKRKTIATRDARLSELHEIAESRGGHPSGTLAKLLDLFHESTKFREELAPTTRRGYEFYRRLAVTLPTKIGALGTLQVARLSPPLMQRLIDRIAAEGTPTKANALLRYLRRVFSWGIARGHCQANPCKGIEAAAERRKHILPTHAAIDAVLAFARVRGALTPRTKGSVAPYLWIVIEIAYLCRLRGIEVITLTDAHLTDAGIRTNRTKGSRDNLVRWTPRLRAAVDAAIEYRRQTTPPNRPIPIAAAARRLIVASGGTPLRRSSLDSAWQRMIHAAIDAGVIAADQRFSLHSMKHRGITDTPGTRPDKQLASGHKSERMLDIYDHSLPTVNPAADG